MSTSKAAKATPHVVGARRTAVKSTPRGNVKVKKIEGTEQPEVSSVKQPAKRGPKDHFRGEEAAYLWARAPDFQAAVRARATGAVTLSAATGLVNTFGEGAFHDDISTGVPMVGQFDQPGDDENTEVATKTACTQTQADAHALRLDVLALKLGQWYRRQLKIAAIATSSVDPPSTQLNVFESLISINTVPPPCRKSMASFYSARYYHTRIKSEYEKEWAAVSAEWKATSKEERLERDLKAPHAVAVRAKIAKQVMAGESKAFLAELKIQNEDDYLARMQAWQQGKTEPTTPQQYHNQLQHAAEHIFPMAQSIAKLMGAAVSIFIVGPIPDSNGVIENRSINVNHPGGVSTQTWPQFDPAGFGRAENSFKSYGVANFTADECRRRTLPDDCQIMIDKRAAASTVDLDDLDALLKLDARSESDEDVAAIPSHEDPFSTTEPLFVPSPSPVTRDQDRPLPSSTSITPDHPYSAFNRGDEEDEELPLIGSPPTALAPSAHPPWSPLSQTQLLSSTREPTMLHKPSPPLVPRSLTRQPTLHIAREQNDELPLLDQAWSRQKNITPMRPRQPLYRVNRSYNISDDIIAGMQEEERNIDVPKPNGVLGKSQNFAIPPQVSQPPSPFQFKGPRPRPPVVMYGRRGRMAQSSPAHKKARGATSSRQPMSHSSPSFGYTRNALPDAKRHPSLANLLTGRPFQSLEDMEAAEEAAEDSDQEQGGVEAGVDGWRRVGEREVGQPGMITPTRPLVSRNSELRTPPLTPTHPAVSASPRTPPGSQPGNRLHNILSQDLFRKSKGLAAQQLFEDEAASRSVCLADFPARLKIPIASTTKVAEFVPVRMSSLPPSSPLSSLHFPSSPVSPLVPATAAPGDWCSLILDTYSYAVANSQVWGGGEEWISLVTMIMEYFDPLMESNQYPETSNPEHSLVRPQEVRSWQTNGRPFEDVHIVNLPIFTAMWWAWWSLMQPPARITNNALGLKESTYSMDWAPLRQPGDSLVLVLVALRWWGVQSRASPQWQEAVADMSSAIFCMTDDGLQNTERGKKGPDAFKALLTQGKHPYSTAPTIPKRARKSGSQAAVSNKRPRSQLTDPPAKMTKTALRTVSTPVGGKQKTHQKTHTRVKHGWEWEPATSSPPPGEAPVADVDEVTEGRQTRSLKRKRAAEEEQNAGGSQQRG